MVSVAGGVGSPGSKEAPRLTQGCLSVMVVCGVEVAGVWLAFHSTLGAYRDSHAEEHGAKDKQVPGADGAWVAGEKEHEEPKSCSHGPKDNNDFSYGVADRYGIVV